MMARHERWLWALLCLAVAGLSWWSGQKPADERSGSIARATPGIRLTMDALHQQGGVPIGWQLTLPPSDPHRGGLLFKDLGCSSCHRVGNSAGSDSPSLAKGPDLAGMGSHHPPAYFVEAILNPDAVLIDAPGFVGEDGHSTMPAYPDMTSSELADVVSFLTSLTQSELPSCHGSASSSMSAVNLSTFDPRHQPSPGDDDSTAYFTQIYDVLPERLSEFETWFASEGREKFLSANGLMRIDTFVDRTLPRNAILTRFSFRNEAALRNFLADPATVELWRRFDSFVGNHGHISSLAPPIYRAPSLSGVAKSE